MWKLTRSFLAGLLLALSFETASAFDEGAVFRTSNGWGEEILDAVEGHKTDDLDHDLWKTETGYLGVPSKEGLSPPERKLLEQASKNGNCESVNALLLAGLLQLHPFLRPAEQPSLPAAAFLESIVKNSIDYRYCLVRKELRQVFDIIRERRVPITLPFYAPPRPYRAAKHGRVYPKPPASHANYLLCSSLSKLSWLAMYRDYPPAISDLIDAVDRHQILRLQPEQDYYLRKRAHRLGLPEARAHDSAGIAHYQLKLVDRRGIERSADDAESLWLIPRFWPCDRPGVLRSDR